MVCSDYVYGDYFWKPLGLGTNLLGKFCPFPSPTTFSQTPSVAAWPLTTPMFSQTPPVAAFAFAPSPEGPVGGAISRNVEGTSLVVPVLGAAAPPRTGTTFGGIVEGIVGDAGISGGGRVLLVVLVVLLVVDPVLGTPVPTTPRTGPSTVGDESSSPTGDPPVGDESSPTGAEDPPVGDASCTTGSEGERPPGGGPLDLGSKGFKTLPDHFVQHTYRATNRTVLTRIPYTPTNTV